MSNKPKRRRLTIIERLPRVKKLRAQRPGFSPWYYKQEAEKAP